MVIMKKLFTIALVGLLSFMSSFLSAQIVSDTLGCVPLLVKFTSPDPSLTSPIWDFKDGASSDLLNPSHVFSTTGTYIITLKNADTLVATAQVVILPELVLNVAVDTDQGCAPLSIQFTDLTQYPEGIVPTSYLWDFGDGSGSTDANPLNTFTDIGEFDITFNLKTNVPQCDIAQTFPDFINILDKQNVGFIIDKVNPLCIVPTTVTYQYTGALDPNAKYVWDFGNGFGSVKAQPDPVIYDKEGFYTVVLEVDNNKGCKSKVTLINDLNFHPIIQASIKDSFCIDRPLSIFNNTNAASFLWDFGPNASPQTSTSKNPINVKFEKLGSQTIHLTATSKYGCKKDTTFITKANNVDASFTFDPIFGCQLPLNAKFIANDKSHASYEWNKVNGGYETSQYINPIIRDSFYYNKLDSVLMILKVTTIDGCMASDTSKFYFQLPNAQFTVNSFEGEEPFLLIVEDKSESHFPIVKWIYTWGDGTSDEYTPDNIHTASHLYTSPGKYYVNLSIVNEAGCVDLYYGAWIDVHERPQIGVPPTCTGGGSGSSVLCYKDDLILTVNNAPPQFDAFHFKLGNTVSACESRQSIRTKAIDDPGFHPLGVTLENGGVFYEFEATSMIKISGTKAKIQYQTNCTDKNLVFFENKSINALQHRWMINGLQITADTFSYRFGGVGDYNVILIAENDSEGCRPDTTEVTVAIRDIKAHISTTDNWCAGVLTKLSSTLSEDAIVGCKMGYFWSFPKYLNKAPVLTEQDTIEVSLPGGKHRLSMEVRDINGCRDTAYKEVIVHFLQADFVIDKPALCDSVTIVCTDKSTHDNPITNYTWSVDPNKNQPMITHKFSSLLEDSIYINLQIKDVFGCVSSKTKAFATYKPESFLDYDPIMCQSNIKPIRATDFNLYGSSLDYSWKLNQQPIQGNHTLNLPDLTPGVHFVNLVITEKSTLCKNFYDVMINVLNDPMAVISGIEDSVFCYPKSFILLADATIKDPLDELTYFWDFGNNRSSSKRNPVVTYGKGNYKVSLTAISKYGCENTTTKQISLVGPEAKILADKENVCKGEYVTFQIKDAIDVTSFYWDFGQGETNNQTSPTSYQYNFVPLSGSTFATLVLESSESGCETVLTLPINIYKVDASFLSDTTCEESLVLTNMSIGADVNIWKFGNQVLSQDFNPNIELKQKGTFPIQLIISNNTNGCRDTTENLVTFLQKPIINLPPFINLCADQTYTFNVNPEYKLVFEPAGVARVSSNTVTIATNRTERVNIESTAANGCITYTSLDILHTAYNNTDFTADYTTCDDFTKVNLKNDLKIGDSVVWTLNGGHLPPGYLSCYDCDEPKIIQKLEGQLTASVYNQNTCLQRTYYYNIENAAVEVPNFFSPNGDKVNDLFGPVLTNRLKEDVVIDNLKIHNRWGKEVYSSNQMWDGMIGGQSAPSEVYYFTLTYSAGNGCRHTVKGDVTLMK